MDPDEFDPYHGRSGWPKALRWVLRVAGLLLGLAVGLYGLGLYALRCFDTCPSNATEDAVFRLETGSLILVGLAIILSAAGAATRSAADAFRIVVALGVLIALVGALSAFLAQSVDSGPGSEDGYVMVGIVMLVVGLGVVAAAAYLLRRIGRTS